MNTKRVIFWTIFIVILALIVWGLVVAMRKGTVGGKLGEPAPISEIDHVKGPVNAPVTMIEYSDFQCSACRIFYPIIEKLLSESSTTVRFVYRQFPLDGVSPETGKAPHPNADISAMASEAAAAQGKFWEMNKLLFTKASEWIELSDPTSTFVGYAEEIGLDIAKFKTDIGS